MKRSNWLSKEDFEKLDEILGKMGYGGYYDFLQCLKIIGRRFNAFEVDGKKINPDDFTNITDLMTFFMLKSE